jgi:hypothetical protein
LKNSIPSKETPGDRIIETIIDIAYNRSKSSNVFRSNSPHGELQKLSRVDAIEKAKKLKAEALRLLRTE